MKRSKELLQIVVFFCIGIGILWLVYRKFAAAYLDDCVAKGNSAADCSLLDKLQADFLLVRWEWLFLVFLVFAAAHLSRAIRWRMLLEPLGYRPRLSVAFWSTCIGYFANLGLPRIGELIRAGTLARYEDLPPEEVMGTIVTDRIVDFVTMFLVIGFAFVAEFDLLWNFVQEQRMTQSSSGSTLPLIGLLLVVVGGSAFLFRKQLVATKLGQKVIGLGKGIVKGILTVKDLKNPIAFVGHSIFIWLMYFLIPLIGFWAFPPTEMLGMNEALMVFIFGTLAIVIPSPGGMGTYHLLVTAALLLYSVSVDDAFSYANIIFFTINLGANIVLGGLGLILLPFIGMRKRKLD